jgi:hypothetical protein
VSSDKLQQNLQRFQKITSGAPTAPPPPAFGLVDGVVTHVAPVGEILPPERKVAPDGWIRTGSVGETLQSELKQVEREENAELANVKAEYRAVLEEEQQLAMRAANEAQRLSELAVASVQQVEQEIVGETVERMRKIQQQTEGMLARPASGRRGSIGQMVAVAGAESGGV